MVALESSRGGFLNGVPGLSLSAGGDGDLVGSELAAEWGTGPAGRLGSMNRVGFLIPVIQLVDLGHFRSRLAALKLAVQPDIDQLLRDFRTNNLTADSDDLGVVAARARSAV